MPENSSISSIFFEKQQGQLCAQHALNMLLQRDLFNAVDLAEIARKLDKEENAVLDSGHRESQNMDDTGFFSVQVISEALKSFHLELISILHPGVSHIKKDPLLARAFICNRSEHWFVIRKFGPQWFELNSCRKGPELLTDFHVALFLTQLTNDGYAIFVIDGELATCAADEVIAANPVRFMPSKRKEASKKEEPEAQKAFAGAGQRLGDATAADAAAAAATGSAAGVVEGDDELMEAIKRSLADQAGTSTGSTNGANGYDDDLRRALEMSTEDDANERSFPLALAMSMQQEAAGKPAAAVGEPVAAGAAAPAARTAAEEARAKREAFLKRFE